MSDAYYTTRLGHDERREKVWRYLTPYLQRFVPENASVLELGAGYCYFINRLRAGRRVAVDLSPEIERWKGPGVESFSGDALEYLRGIEPQQFDFILASNFFEHFEWPALQEMIALIFRALKTSGRLAVIQPNFRLAAGRYFDDYTHRTIFTDVSLGDWLRAGGFDIVKMIPRFLPLSVKSRAGGLSFLVPLYLRLPYRPLAGQMFALAERPATGSIR
ncbi:MAG TPA: class I SAM-dependent methyltransferase [Thermoanaerobaculia bacterium]|jgi:SAM-dependent methyltransferase|nr:class I SAM-dependent methyltransferase [Thermoanaerobaculia bacterium]